MAVRVTTDEVLQQMRRSGGRITTQRRLVLDALVATQPHPSVEDVVEHVQRHDPDLHRSTVYRTLNTLAGLGIVSHVHLDHGRSVYHFAHDAEPHLVCRVCGGVTHLAADRFAEIRSIVADSTGFDLEHGHFAWTARCGPCRSAGADQGPAARERAGNDLPDDDHQANERQANERQANERPAGHHIDHEHSDHEHTDHEHTDHEHSDHEHSDHEHTDGRPAGGEHDGDGRSDEAARTT